MEVGILLNDLKKYKGKLLAGYTFTFGDSANNGVSSAYQCLAGRVPDTITHLYFGCEFCEYRLPDKGQLDQFMELSNADDLIPVFVTPVVSDYGLGRLQECFSVLRERQPGMAVVVNDYGVAELLRTRFPELSMVAGRVLDKLSHDARVTQSGLQMYYGSEGMRYASEPGVISHYAQEVFRRYRIERFEFDLPKTGIHLPESKRYFSLYWPFHYLTTGRVCLFRSMTQAPKDRFLVGGESGSGPCEAYELELRKPLTGFQIDYEEKVSDLFLYQKGNTVFYLLTEAALEDALPQFDRIVVEVL